MSKIFVDIDDEALKLAMAHYGTSEKCEAINRALREVADRRIDEAGDLDRWVVGVGGQLAGTDWRKAWRQ